MNSMQSTAASVIALEALMLEKYRKEPFHNLYLLYNKEPVSPMYGGTCSDKTLSFLSSANHAGFQVALHSGFIDGRDIHRLVRVHIENRVFFADVGNGWPALKLYPADQEISYSCFGMSFRTRISENRMAVYHRRNGKESIQLEIDLSRRPEADIQADIAARFNTGIAYPFSNSLRFSLVVDDRFLFLRGDRLEIYSEDGFEVLEGIVAASVPAIIGEYFQFDIQQMLRYLLLEPNTTAVCTQWLETGEIGPAR